MSLSEIIIRIRAAAMHAHYADVRVHQARMRRRMQKVVAASPPMYVCVQGVHEDV
jgi:hypothetical protein